MQQGKIEFGSDHGRKVRDLLASVLNKEDWQVGKLSLGKKAKKIPVVFTRDEAKKVLLHLRGKYWLVSSLLFGSGLRLMEALTLHVKDLDFTDRQLTIHEGSWRAISSGDFDSPTQPTTNRPIIIEIIVLCFICVTSTT